MAPPPVYAGFGSMPSEAAVAKTEVVLDALAQAGQRGVICPFFGDQPFWGLRVAALGVGPAPPPAA